MAKLLRKASRLGKQSYNFNLDVTLGRMVMPSELAGEKVVVVMKRPGKKSLTSKEHAAATSWEHLGDVFSSHVTMYRARTGDYEAKTYDLELKMVGGGQILARFAFDASHYASVDGAPAVLELVDFNKTKKYDITLEVTVVCKYASAATDGDSDNSSTHSNSFRNNRTDTNVKNNDSNNNSAHHNRASTTGTQLGDDLHEYLDADSVATATTQHTETSGVILGGEGMKTEKKKNTYIISPNASPPPMTHAERAKKGRSPGAFLATPGALGLRRRSLHDAQSAPHSPPTGVMDSPVPIDMYKGLVASLQTGQAEKDHEMEMLRLQLESVGAEMERRDKDSEELEAVRRQLATMEKELDKRGKEREYLERQIELGRGELETARAEFEDQQNASEEAANARINALSVELEVLRQMVDMDNQNESPKVASVVQQAKVVEASAQQIASLKAELKSFQMKQKDFETKARLQAEKLLSFEETEQQLKARLAESETLLKASEQTVASLQLSLQMEMAESREAGASLERRSSEAKTQAVHGAAEVEILKTALQQAHEQLESLQGGRSQGGTAPSATKKDDSDEEDRSLIEELQAQLLEAEAVADSSERKVDMLQAELNEKNRTLQQVTQELERAQDEDVRTCSASAEAVFKLSEAEHVAFECKTELETLKLEFDALENRAQTAETGLIEANSRLVQVNRLEAAVEEAKVELIITNSALEKQFEEMHDAHVKLAEEREEKAEIIRKSSHSEIKALTLQEQLDATIASKRALQVELELLIEERDALKAQTARGAADVSEQQVSLAATKKAIAESLATEKAEVHVEGLETHVKVAEESVHKLQADLSLAISENEKLEKELQDTRRQLTLAVNRVGELEGTVQLLKDEIHIRDEDTSKEELEDLKDLLDNIITERDAAMIEVSRLEESLKAAATTHTGVSVGARWSKVDLEDVRNLQEEVAQLKLERAMLESKLHAATLELEEEEGRHASALQNGNPQKSNGPQKDSAAAKHTKEVVLRYEDRLRTLAAQHEAQKATFRRLCENAERDAEEQKQLLGRAKTDLASVSHEYEKMRLSYWEKKRNSPGTSPPKAPQAPGGAGGGMGANSVVVNNNTAPGLGDTGFLASWRRNSQGNT